MTILRRDPSAISNYFNNLLSGLGKRGSSFADVDAVTHDADTDRFLFQEFKNSGEELNRGQKMLLAGLARKDYVTVWCVRRLGDGRLEWCDVASRQHGVISERSYQAMFQAWWAGRPVIPDFEPEALPVLTTVTSDEIRW